MHSKDTYSCFPEDSYVVILGSEGCFCCIFCLFESQASKSRLKWLFLFHLCSYVYGPPSTGDLSNQSWKRLPCCFI